MEEFPTFYMNLNVSVVFLFVFLNMFYAAYARFETQCNDNLYWALHKLW